MKYFEFGQEHPELMVMLHGGGGYVYLARHRQLHGKEAGETRQSVAGRGICLYLQGISQHGSRNAGWRTSGAVFE
ncbi:hypothetical protein HMPREF0239_00658 [Clostridium sp. ATCC BAA-442]|nr:hypothetical protein HMPREF0239_00658 [Clostridium sp. ATCC BAA-442]